jgi:ATP-binding cassette subfamily C protein CydD
MSDSHSPAKYGPLVGAALGLVSVAANLGLFASLSWLLFSPTPIVWLPWAAVCLALVKAGVVFASRALVPHWSRAERRGLRSRLFQALVRRARRPGASDQGEALSLVTEGVDSLELYRGLFFPQLLVGAVAPLVVTGVLCFVDHWSALILLIFAPVTPVAVNVLRKAFQTATTRYYQETAHLTTRFQEGILGLPTLALFGVAGRYGDAVEKDAAEHRRSAVGLMVVNQLLLLFMDLFSSLGATVAATVLAVVRYGQGALGAPEALFLVLASVELNRPLQLMGAFFFAGTMGRNTLKRAKSILADHEAAAPTEPGAAESFSASATCLEVDDVSYQYPGGEGGVEALSLSLAPGTLVGLAGPSGSGKTTAKRLIGGLLTPVSGSVLVDGVPVGPVALGRLVGATDQNPVLFEGTVAENLALGLGEGPGPGVLDAVLDRVGLRGLDRVLGEDGRGVSGGQKARIALARALLRPTPFLVLDEPSADLDPATEALVLEVARRESRHRGVLLISHRRAVLGACDRVVTLEHGAN